MHTTSERYKNFIVTKISASKFVLAVCVENQVAEIANSYRVIFE